MSEQSICAISSDLEVVAMRFEIFNDEDVKVFFSGNDGTIELPLSDVAMIDIALAILDVKQSKMPSKTELKTGFRTGFRVLRGKEGPKTRRIPCEGSEKSSPIVNVILAFMERQPNWQGKTKSRFIDCSLKDGSSTSEPLSRRAFAHRINEYRKAFRFIHLSIQTIRFDRFRHERMHWLEESDASDHKDEEREALEAMATFRSTQHNDLEKH